jgi:enoyl-coA hydratase, R-specific
MKFKDLKVGMFECIEKIITELDVINFSKISLDENPLHLDEEYAKKNYI